MTISSHIWKLTVLLPWMLFAQTIPEAHLVNITSANSSMETLPVAQVVNDTQDLSNTTDPVVTMTTSTVFTSQVSSTTVQDLSTSIATLTTQESFTFIIPPTPISPPHPVSQNGEHPSNIRTNNQHQALAAQLNQQVVVVDPGRPSLNGPNHLQQGSNSKPMNDPSIDVTSNASNPPPMSSSQTSDSHMTQTVIAAVGSISAVLFIVIGGFMYSKHGKPLKKIFSFTKSKDSQDSLPSILLDQPQMERISIDSTSTKCTSQHSLAKEFCLPPKQSTRSMEFYQHGTMSMASTTSRMSTLDTPFVKDETLYKKQSNSSSILQKMMSIGSLRPSIVSRMSSFSSVHSSMSEESLSTYLN